MLVRLVRFVGVHVLTLRTPLGRKARKGFEAGGTIVVRVKPEPALMELQAEQERRLRRVGVAPETRKFTPHVTLARLRR